MINDFLKYHEIVEERQEELYKMVPLPTITSSKGYELIVLVHMSICCYSLLRKREIQQFSKR